VRVLRPPLREHSDHERNEAGLQGRPRDPMSRAI
jgi:hypothetical protein